MSDFLWPQGLQHSGLLCPSLSPGVCSNSYPLRQWGYLTVSPSASLFSSCPQSFPASESFTMSWLCIRWPEYGSFSFSISPSNDCSGLIWSSYQVWFPYQKLLSVLIYLSFFSKIYLKSGNVSLLHCIPNVLLSPRYIEGTQYICFIYLFKERVSPDLKETRAPQCSSQHCLS